MAATACLYNLSKAELGLKVHPACLREIVDLTLLAMMNFPNHQQLQKNALLTLCSDRILQDVVRHFHPIFSIQFKLGSHRLEKYLNLEGFLEKSWKIKYAL